MTAVQAVIPRDVDGQLAVDFLQAITEERLRAHAKHGATSMEQSETLSHRRASILMEEAAECGKALNDYEHEPLAHQLRARVDPEIMGAYSDDLDKELVQTAAMAYTWWANRRGDRLPAPEPEPVERCAWTHEGRTCGMPRNAHSRTRTGGFLVGHAFEEPVEPECLGAGYVLAGDQAIVPRKGLEQVLEELRNAVVHNRMLGPINAASMLNQLGATP